MAVFKHFSTAVFVSLLLCLLYNIRTHTRTHARTHTRTHTHTHTLHADLSCVQSGHMQPTREAKMRMKRHKPGSQQHPLHMECQCLSPCLLWCHNPASNMWQLLLRKYIYKRTVLLAVATTSWQLQLQNAVPAQSAFAAVCSYANMHFAATSWLLSLQKQKAILQWQIMAATNLPLGLCHMFCSWPRFIYSFVLVLFLMCKVLQHRFSAQSTTPTTYSLQ